MMTPLADRIRPETLDDIVGQTHLIGDGKPLRNIIESGELPNLIFYGPSGTGKTTLARMIAKKTDRALRRLNCTTAGTLFLHLPEYFFILTRFSISTKSSSRRFLNT